MPNPFSETSPNKRPPKRPVHMGRPRIALVASIAWTLWNYRLSLIKALENAGYEVLLFAQEDSSRAQIEQHTQAQFFPLHQLSRRSMSLLQNLRCLLELYQVLRQQRPDLVLFFTIRPNTLGNFAASAAGIPSISTIEGLGISGTSQRWLKKLTQWLYRLAFRHTQKVVFLNRDDQEEFVKLNILKPEKTLLVHGPGVDLHHFTPRAKSDNPQKIVFLFVARLLTEKGIREFVEAASMLKSKGLGAQYLVAGNVDEGNPTSIESEELNQWIREETIQHLGFLDDIRPAIAAADVLVLPSYYREGVPRSVLEAMAMGKPIITTNNVGCRDTVEEGKNGFLIPPLNVPALVLAMEQIAALSPEQRAAMGQYSRQKAITEFADQRVLPQYLALINALLKP